MILGLKGLTTGLYQLKVDVGMLNTVKNDLADVLSIKPFIRAIGNVTLMNVNISCPYKKVAC